MKRQWGSQRDAKFYLSYAPAIEVFYSNYSPLACSSARPLILLVKQARHVVHVDTSQGGGGSETRFAAMCVVARCVTVSRRASNNASRNDGEMHD